MTGPDDHADLLAGIGSDDLDDFDFEDSSQPSPNDHEASGRFRTDNDEEDPFTSDPFNSDPSTSEPMRLPVVAFSTARGHTLPPPSESSIARAKKLLEEPEGEHEILVTAPSPKRRKLEETPISLFTTGGGRSITPPTREAFDKAASLLCLDPDPALATPRPGFTTGSGHKLPPPSLLAQAAVSRLFGDIESTSESSLDASRSSNAADPSFQNATTRFSDHTSPEAISTPRAIVSAASERGHQTPKSNSVAPSLSPENATSIPASHFRSPLVNVRTPLRTTTNASGTPMRALSIDIKAPTRRLGLMATPSSDKKAAQKFVTPFKNPQVAQMQKTNKRVTPLRLPTAPRDVTVFDLQKPLNRQTMREAFLKPQYYSPGELRELGIPEDISILDLKNATNYEFTAEDLSILNKDTALKVLLQEGCRLVSAKWVSNHWSLILWKLAGQIQAQPSLFDQKWKWGEVIQQLKYRYEREYGAAQRPIIRKIQEHDASSAGPMVLCITQIHWPTNDLKNGTQTRANPYLELTDGWYRIQAELDDCLSRAVRSLKITVGRKLAIAGARLESTTDGADVLDALHNSRIKITGNSCHLARWDARLGSHEPFVASLASLSVDGGIINLMGLIIQKLYPVAYVGAGQSNAPWEPPWNEEEEAMRCDQWKEAYMNEMTLRNEELRRSMGALQDFVSLLESNAEEANSSDYTILEDIDEVFEKLFSAKDPTVHLRQLTGSQIVQLKKHGKARLEDELDAGRRQVERDIQVACPPRQVRRFRMARVVDMLEGIRQPFREGMLNIWDATDVGLKEGGKYFVSNVYPGKSGDWSIPKTIGVKKEVYLHTRKDTRWHFVA